MFKLKIISASTRPGRKGPVLATWIMEESKKHHEFEPELLDLANINLPFLDEPEHPRFQKYQHEHTWNWSRVIDSADAFIFVMPEYNFGYPATIKNALDYLFKEWTYKPVGFVTYGGNAGDTKSQQMLKQVVTAMKMVPLFEAVNVPFFTKYINNQGVFTPDENVQKAADAMFAELLKWTGPLQ